MVWCTILWETNGCKDLRFYQGEKVKQPWSFNKGYCHFDCSFIMPPWHPFLHHFTIVFQLQEIIKAIYAADAANGSFYYKSVFHPGGLRAKPDPHSRHSKKVTLFSGETVTPAKFWIGGLNKQTICWTASSIAQMEVLFPTLQKKLFKFFSFSGGFSNVQIGPGIQNFKKISSGSV